MATTPKRKAEGTTTSKAAKGPKTTTKGQAKKCAAKVTLHIKSSAASSLKPKHFHRPNNETQSKLRYDKRPQNNTEREEAKKKGTLWGYSMLKPGRPTKNNDETDEVEEDSTQPAAAAKVSRAERKRPARGAYTKYTGKEGEAMDAAVNAYILAGANNPYAAAKVAAAKIAPMFTPSRTTVISRVEKRKSDTQNEASKDEHYFDRKSGGGGRGLTSKEEQQLLQDIAVRRDNKNDGFGRKEMIQVVSHLAGATIGKATEHYKYLVRNGKLTSLKRGGRVVRAQATTTNRTAITTAKLLRTYMAQEEGK
jgi:hypothetical protein